MRLAEPGDVKMEAIASGDEDEDTEDDTYECSDQSESESDDELEADDESKSADDVDLEKQIVVVLEEWSAIFVEAAEEGSEVHEKLAKDRRRGYAEGRILVAEAVAAFRELAEVVGQDPEVVIRQMATHSGKLLLDKKGLFAWFDKTELIDAYLTIGRYTATEEDVERALGELDQVHDEGRIHVLKLASGLKAQAME